MGLSYSSRHILPVTSEARRDRQGSPNSLIVEPEAIIPKKKKHPRQGLLITRTPQKISPTFPHPHCLWGLLGHPCRALAGVGLGHEGNTPDGGLRWLGDRTGYRVGSLSAAQVSRV